MLVLQNTMLTTSPCFRASPRRRIDYTTSIQHNINKIAPQLKGGNILSITCKNLSVPSRELSQLLYSDSCIQHMFLNKIMSCVVFFQLLLLLCFKYSLHCLIILSFIRGKQHLFPFSQHLFLMGIVYKNWEMQYRGMHVRSQSCQSTTSATKPSVSSAHMPLPVHSVPSLSNQNLVLHAVVLQRLQMTF